MLKLRILDDSNVRDIVRVTGKAVEQDLQNPAVVIIRDGNERDFEKLRQADINVVKA